MRRVISIIRGADRRYNQGDDMETRNFGGVDVNLFLPMEEVEPSALQQVIATSKHPHAVGPVAIMPDCHTGYGVTIGTILRTEGVVIPNAVGVDIGCGMTVYNTGVSPSVMTPQSWRLLDEEIRRRIPMGFNGHETPNYRPFMDNEWFLMDRKPNRPALQFATLGGGNHFLEVGTDGESLYLIVHSGSRGYGHDVAQKFDTLAQAENMRRTTNRASQGLEHLLVTSELGAQYIAEAANAEMYASESRKAMIFSMFIALAQVANVGSIDNFGILDVPHNYAEIDLHTGIMTHWKGAVSARLHEKGIIPGSMGTSTFLTEGLGNKDALESSSHGAGRTMSRGQARRTYGIDQFQEMMEGTYSRVSETLLDESPMAYKDINEVIARQSTQIKVLTTLTPLLTLKGGGRDEG